MFDRLPLRGGNIFGMNVSRNEFYRRVLKALKTRRGLIHGTMEQNGRVCAVGALRASVRQGKYGLGFGIKMADAKDLQQVNDSVPTATPSERLKIVREWLREQIKHLEI